MAKLTEKDEVTLYAVRFRWAFEELVYDSKMTELNRISCRGPIALFNYIKEAKGSGIDALKALRQTIRNAVEHVPAIDMNNKEVRNAEAKRICRNVEWAVDALALELKNQEAIELFKSLNSMYVSLVNVYGGRSQVLDGLRWIVKHQNGRRKTIGLQGVD